MLLYIVVFIDEREWGSLMVYYKSKRIKIRDIEEEDVIPLFRWWIDRDVNLYDPRPIPDDPKGLMEECSRYCKRFMKEVMNKKKSQNRYHYFIITNMLNRPIGFINIFSFNEDRTEAELGIIIGNSSYWKKGIAYESMGAVLRYLFEEKHYKRIHIETGEDNNPARNLFTKLGFMECDAYLDEGYPCVVMEITSTAYYEGGHLGSKK